jgi:hypothetical protein
LRSKDDFAACAVERFAVKHFSIKVIKGDVDIDPSLDIEIDPLDESLVETTDLDDFN